MRSVFAKLDGIYQSIYHIVSHRFTEKILYLTVSDSYFNMNLLYLTRLCSPERGLLEKSMSGWAGSHGAGLGLGAGGALGGGALGGGAGGALYVPDCEEVRVSAAVARRGHLNVLQHGTHGWKKRWLVCTCIHFFHVLASIKGNRLMLPFALLYYTNFFKDEDDFILY